LNHQNEKSNIEYIIEWLISDINSSFDLIMRDALSTNDDSRLRHEVATALWARALIKLSTFIDYIKSLAKAKQTKDRIRVIKLFNLETHILIPHCEINEVQVLRLLKKLRDEVSHGTQANSVVPLRNIVIDKKVAYVQCRNISIGEDCNMCGVFKCDRSIASNDKIYCRIKLSDVIDAISIGMKSWSVSYKKELMKVVNERRKLASLPFEDKSNDSIPWWYEPSDELWAYRF